MKLTDRIKIKTLGIALICIFGLLALVGASYAAYTSQAYQRGVARNRDSEIIRFSSNYLQLYTNNTAENAYVNRKISVGDNVTEGTNYNVDITVFNYANGNTNLISQRDITYTMTIKISGDYANQCSVSDGTTSKTFENETVSYGKTLRGRTATSDRYRVTIPSEAVNKVAIIATAVPGTGTLAITNNQILAGVLAPCTGDVTKTFRAEGRFTDADAGGIPTDYDGFNYEISISSGTATGTLKWDSTILEIDKYFLDKIKYTGSEDKGNISFKMDQSNGTGDYLIPFYIKDKAQIKSSWAEMEKLITFDAEQSTENEEGQQ